MSIGRKIGDWFKKADSSTGTGRTIGICFGAVLLACILFWVGLLIDQSTKIENIGLDNTSTFENSRLEVVDNCSIFTVVLPEAFELEQSVLFKSSHATVEILLDGEVIYRFGIDENGNNIKPVLGKSPGTCWHVANIPSGSAGHELVIRRTSVYSSYKGTDANFYYGSRGDCILKLVDNFLYVLIMNAVSIVLGIICLMFHLRTFKRKEIQAQNGFLWIGLFALIIAVWSLRQCGFLRLLIPDSEVLYFVDIHTLFLAPAALDMFVYSFSKTRWGKSCLWFIPVYLFGVSFGMLMQIFGVFDIVEMLTALHIFIGINAVYMLLAVHMEAWKNKGSAANRFRIPLYTMLAFGIMEIIYYYMPVRTTSIFLPTGVTIFILLLVWQQVQAYFHMLEEQKLLYYEQFANTDMLTGALNRNAYETRLKELAGEEAELSGYSAALFDLNGLKAINDNFGHEKGDEAIKRCYELIVTAFGEKENCYRIGGDEFVFLGLNETDVEEKIANFDRLVAGDREQLEYPFEVAFGYAVFDVGQDKDLQDMIKRSDAMMYQDKKEKKHLS